MLHTHEGRIKALILLLAATIALAQKPEPAFTITVSISQAVVTAKSPVEVDVILKNTSNHDLRVFVDSSAKAELSGFGAEVTDSQALVPKITKYHDVLTGEKAPRERVANPDEHLVIVGSGGTATVGPGVT